ncbi:MAG: polyprenyl synthetase family protein [Dehalococcoidia bacterium]|nr:polyprenyl synthetase family protein [Dehalococcoidia bacterium]
MPVVGAEVKPQVPRLLGAYQEALGPALRGAVSGAAPDLLLPLHYHLGWVDAQGHPTVAEQGKGLRPTLCLFACEAMGAPPERALPAAVALECIHNFSLIHDDIQDGDRERRHRPTVWAVWGVNKALTAGNALRVLADLALLRLHWSGVSAQVVVQASRVLTEGYLEMIEGQVLDLSYETRLDITVQDYLHMVSKKTAALMGVALHLGTLVAGAAETAVDALRQAGRLLGIAFQVQDDVLGIWGERAVTGKAVGADIVRRKKSFPIVYALQYAPQELATRLRTFYQGESMNLHQVAQVLDILDKVQARSYAQRTAHGFCQEALNLARPVLPSWAADALEELAHFVVDRPM